MTIYLDENKFNDLTKSPLRIKVLESLAIKGKLSKSMAESLFSKMHYYPDISNAFDNLLQNSLIEGAGKKVSRGRPEVFYRITDEGLALIIYKYHHDPKKFWSLLTGFCYHRDEQVSLARVGEFYNLFVNKHLKYPSGHNYFFQLDLFSKMSDKWIQDNAKNKNKISLEQKVIETLSMYPAIALKELVKKIEERRQEKVVKVLDSYTMKKLHYTDVYDTAQEDEGYSENPLTQYLDLMHHCIVTVGHTAKGVETYELSLFGIIIAMTLVRYHEMGRIGSLFYHHILLQDYYNKIASNYKYALPLIFGKWYLLKTHLKIWSAYNFDIILGGKQVRSKTLHSSVLAKGNKEFYENMQPISEFSSNQIGLINNLGIEVLENYKRDKSEYQFVDNNNKRKIIEENKDGDANDRVIAISQKLQEIFILMKYTHPWAFQEDLVREEVSRYGTKKPYLLKAMRTDNNDSGISVIDILTKAFEKEITFLYYLNLFNDFYVPLLLPNAGFDSILQESAPSLISKYFNMHSQLSKSSTHSMQLHKDYYPFYLSPKEKLFSILQNDEAIRSSFSAWIEDIVNYQKETTEFMTKSYLEVKERINIKNGN